MAAYYNEFDSYAADWLENLIAAGHIAPGDVDRRSIEDVCPDDLAGYTQCHFFAGIGVWPYALRRAGWSDDRPVWTGSCPCPPFSSAGKGSECPSCGGRSCLSHPVVTAGWICLNCGDEWRGDDRHLLPEFIRLIGQCGPPAVVGEQVASRDGRLWLYTLRAVLETVGYAVGASDLCAAGVGAPHIRQRLFFVAERLADGDGHGRAEERPGVSETQRDGTERDGAAGGLEHGFIPRLEGHGRDVGRWNEPGRVGADAAGSAAAAGGACGLADGPGTGRRPERPGCNAADGDDAFRAGASESGRCCSVDRPSPTDGFWRDPDWLFCRDGKWRPVEPGTSPLAHGAPSRVGRLRAYGNAIVAPLAATFIKAWLEAREDCRYL